MSKVYWDNGEEITDDALLSFFTGSTTYDLMKEELCQLKHEMTQDSSTVPLADVGANDMLREELSKLQQTRVHQEDTNNNTSTEEVCWIGGEEPTEEQIRFLVGTGSNDMLREELRQLQQPQVHQEDASYLIEDDGPDTPAIYQEKKILVPVPRFTVVDESLHFALQRSGDEVDRLTSSFNKKGLMSREDYNDLCSSIERIHGYLQKTVKPDNIEEYASGLEKLLNSGHITNDQAKAYKKQYNIG